MAYAIVAVIALILDQAVKYWTTANIVLDIGERKLIPGVIHLSNVHNTGAAFSFLEGARWFFVILCLIFVAAIIFLLAKNIISGRAARWMSVMVMAGAVGNCIDRVINGYVVDMFELEFMTFPVFNVADIYITVCGVIFCLCILFEKDASPDKKAAAPAAPRRPAKKPVVSRRQETDAPEFSHAPRVPAPDIDPNDPFAEWERIASGERAPAAAEPAAPAAAAPSEPVSGLSEDAEDTDAIASEDESPAPPSVPAEAPDKAPDEPASGGSFDLDDILEEYRDK